MTKQMTIVVIGALRVNVCIYTFIHFHISRVLETRWDFQLTEPVNACHHIYPWKYSKTCVRQPPLKLTLVVDVERWLSYKGTCHVILLAKLHDMYLYKTDNFFHINHYLKSRRWLSYTGFTVPIFSLHVVLATSCDKNYFKKKKPCYQPVQVWAYISVISHMGKQGASFCTPMKIMHVAMKDGMHQHVIRCNPQNKG